MKPTAARVASRWLGAATTPLPKLTRDEPGLMTLQEYLDHRNPGGKFHDTETYDWSLAQMNRGLYAQYLGTEGDFEISETPLGLLFRREGRLVGILPTQGAGSGTLYYDWAGMDRKIPKGYWDRNANKYIPFDIAATKRVKYLSEALPQVNPIAKANMAKFGVLLQRIKSKGESFTVRADGQPGLNKGVTLAILNNEDQVVAQASDEWGETLLVVAKEYRGRGLGKVLGRFWYEQNPSKQSGGYTESGQSNAIGMWEARVREFLSKGWYSELATKGSPDLRAPLPKERVQEILAGLPGRRPKLPDPPAPTKKQILVYVDYPSFIVYDARFLDDPEAEDADDYIHGYGFFRDSPQVGSFLFTLDYDRPFHEITTLAALQMARDEGEPVYVGEGYGDFLEVEGLPVEQEGDYVTLARDMVPLASLGAKERRIRQKVDPYGEKQVLLLEKADSKWS